MKKNLFPIKSQYAAIKRKTARISALLSGVDAKDAVLAYNKIQKHEALTRKSWADCEAFWNQSKTFKSPALSLMKLLKQFNLVSAKIAAISGVTDAKEILDYDEGDELVLSGKLESVFASNQRDDLASVQKRLRNDALKFQRAYASDQETFAALNEKLSLSISKLQGELGMGLVALKNNKIELPQKSVAQKAVKVDSTVEPVATAAKVN
jgi:hypothetical protein